MLIHMRRAIIVTVILLWVGSAPAAAATPSAPLEVESLARQSTVSAYDQLLAWSRYDPAAQDYRLVAADVGNLAAPPQVLPVAPRTIAFDVDLGPDAHGRTVAVCSRCTTEPAGDYYGQKLWPNNAAGCDIYEYDFAARREHKLTASNSFTFSPAPAGWRLRRSSSTASGSSRPRRASASTTSTPARSATRPTPPGVTATCRAR